MYFRILSEKIAGMDWSRRLVDAVGRGDARRVREALARGADANAAGVEGDAVIVVAAGRGDVEVVRALVEAGAAVDAQASAVAETALRVAAAVGSVEMVTVLLEAGADPLRPGRMTLTPLDRARERRTSEGRVIYNLMLRHLEARGKAALPARKPVGGRRGKQPK